MEEYIVTIREDGKPDEDVVIEADSPEEAALIVSKGDADILNLQNEDND